MAEFTAEFYVHEMDYFCVIELHPNEIMFLVNLNDNNKLLSHMQSATYEK